MKGILKAGTIVGAAMVGFLGALLLDVALGAYDKNKLTEAGWTKRQ